MLFSLLARSLGLMEPPPPPDTKTSDSSGTGGDRDLLIRVERYLVKRDGVDKLLKISRYAAKIALASSLLPPTHPLHPRLKSFESSVGISRKAFRLGKFIQDLNAYRAASFASPGYRLVALLAYGGEGLYYFIEQIEWLSKTGLIDPGNVARLQKMSAWAEFVGYVGSMTLKSRELRRMAEDEAELLVSSKGTGGRDWEEVEERLRKLRTKVLMKKMSILQDTADAVMAIGDIRDGKGLLSGPLLMASAGLLSALISTHKNWSSC